ncbi:MAG: aquaporin [Bryobacteraceae bacterium]
MNKYIAEFVGTFTLALAVGLSIVGKFPVPTPVIAGLTLGVAVYTFGAISGTHLNPAITLGLLSVGRISVKDAVIYVAVQIAGGATAMMAAGALASVPAAGSGDSAVIFACEALGTFILAIGVASVVYGKAPAPAAGLTIGGSLLVGIALAAAGSNGVLNPAVAVTIGSVSLSYLLAPIVGAVVAMLLYRLIARS